MTYQLRLRRRDLLRLCATWRKSLQSLGTRQYPVPDWGPSEEELLDARVEQVTAAVIDEEDEDDDVAGVEFDEPDEVPDLILLEVLESVERADALRSDHEANQMQNINTL